MIAGTEEGRQLLVHDLDDLLPGVEAVEDLRAHGTLADAGDEVLDDLVVDVRFEQCESDLAHGGIDVGLADPAATGQSGEGLAQAFRERVEHGSGVSP